MFGDDFVVSLVAPELAGNESKGLPVAVLLIAIVRHGIWSR